MQPGIFDNIPFDSYRAVRAVNKSLLDELLLSPAHARDCMDGIKSEPTAPMTLGSAVDCLVCEPDQFEKRFYIRPATYEADDTTKPWNGNAKACKEWLRLHQDLPVLSPDVYEHAKLIAETLKAHKLAMSILTDCKTQQSVFWQDKYSGLFMKGRPDFLSSRYAADLKVVKDASNEAISKAIQDYRYHVQAAIYTDGIEVNGHECNTFYFVFVESGDVPRVNVKYLKSEAINLGRQIYHEQLTKLQWCIIRNHWPDYSGDSIGEIDLPAWVYGKMEGLTLKIGGEEYGI